MTNKEILQKAIKKVEENGCNRCYSSFLDYHNERDIVEYKKHYQIIFSHDFAKAFWGEDLYHPEKKQKIINHRLKIYASCFDMNSKVNIIAWRYHLQQMVICEEPIKYLEEYL